MSTTTIAVHSPSAVAVDVSKCDCASRASKVLEVLFVVRERDQRGSAGIFRQPRILDMARRSTSSHEKRRDCSDPSQVKKRERTLRKTTARRQRDRRQLASRKRSEAGPTNERHVRAEVAARFQSDRRSSSHTNERPQSGKSDRCQRVSLPPAGKPLDCALVTLCRHTRCRTATICVGTVTQLAHVPTSGSCAENKKRPGEVGGTRTACLPANCIPREHQERRACDQVQPGDEEEDGRILLRNHLHRNRPLRRRRILRRHRIHHRRIHHHDGHRNRDCSEIEAPVSSRLKPWVPQD